MKPVHDWDMARAVHAASGRRLTDRITRMYVGQWHAGGPRIFDRNKAIDKQWGRRGEDFGLLKPRRS